VRKHGCSHKNIYKPSKICEDVISAQPENATAALGSDNPTIEEGYRQVDFELRVLKAEVALNDFVHTL
jgi:hypothetical protein